MGRPFSSELTRLPGTLAWAEDVDIATLTNFLSRARGHTLVVVGAGGSFTTAELARQLHESRGDVATAHTPLSFLQSGTDLRRAHVLIYSASGNNRDVLATYAAAAEREPLSIFILCGRRTSKIGRAAAKAERASVLALKLPYGKDGYLATNSLLAFAALTVRAYGHPVTVNLPGAMKPLKAAKDHYLALFGDWARPAATDLESKFSEAGLGHVMLADYRHFAHGRHNWIDKRGERTAVVAFVTPESEPLARRTLALLPKSIEVITLRTKLDGPGGSLELLPQVFRLTEAVGGACGIDPGRPGVPGYGRKIYHLGPQRVRSGPKAAVEAASVDRKRSARGTLHSEADRKIVAAARTAYLERLAAARFGALVLDFDGTVMPPASGRGAKLSAPVKRFLESLVRGRVELYFATGRGDSIHGILRDALDAKLHDRIWVSYYNGGVTRTLSDECPVPEAAPHFALLEDFEKRLMDDRLLRTLAKPENKGYQLTLKAQNIGEFCSAIAMIRELVNREAPGRVRVVESSHSVDVIPAASSKLSCVHFAQGRLSAGLELVTLGDRGALGGNDFDLLTHRFSLSVDTVSADLNSCWNLLPPGCRNVAGLVAYTRAFRLKMGSFALSIE